MPPSPVQSRTAPLRVVALGGGTGLSRLLIGLKAYVRESGVRLPARAEWSISELTAIVTVSDDGGSSGRLREELRMPPPGDIRNCLVALSRCEPLLSQLFRHRFQGTGELGGHSFGNLFLAALSDITGDFASAVQVCSQVLAVSGKIYPATLTDVRLAATCEDGTTLLGESNITRSPLRKERISLRPAGCQPVPEALQAIRDADIITVGPGSLLTSILPSLLVRRVSDAIKRSRAVKIYIGNIMTQPGETDGYTAADHVRMIYRHTGVPVFDAVILNSRPVGAAMRRKYRAQGAAPLRVDRRDMERLGIKVYTRPLALEEDVVRHDAGKLAQTIGRIYADLRPEAAMSPGRRLHAGSRPQTR